MREASGYLPREVWSLAALGGDQYRPDVETRRPGLAEDAPDEPADHSARHPCEYRHDAAA